MTTYIKSIRYKLVHDKTNKDEGCLPCATCTKKCRGTEKCREADCDDIKNWFRGMGEMAVEFEASYDLLVMMRILCRTLVWLTLMATAAYVTWKWGR